MQLRDQRLRGTDYYKTMAMEMSACLAKRAEVGIDGVAQHYFERVQEC